MSKDITEDTLRSITLVTNAHVNNAEKAVKRRDHAIREAHATGLSYGKLAVITGLSRARIQQICNNR
jgi:hypothetical protein